MSSQRNSPNLNRRIERFLLSWYDFPIDYWWRQRYKVPFGSEMHRSQNWLDMAIEFKEVEMMAKNDDFDPKFDDYLRSQGITTDGGKEVVKMTKEEVIEEYDNLDLSKF